MKLIVDIETCFTRNDEVRSRIADGIKHPATMSKKETIDKWEAEKKPLAVDEAVSKTALSASYGEITCIGYCSLDGEVISIARDDTKSEAELLTMFFDQVSTMINKNTSIQIIGFNVLFDYEFLRIRSIINGIKPPFDMPTLKAWDKRIYDVKNEFYGESVSVSGIRNSLDNTAKLLSISGKYNGISGAEAPKMWLDGKYAELSSYCAQDVEMTREIYKRINFL